MARKLHVQLIDDLDGRPAPSGQTVTFGLDGVHYEIDLCPENAAELRERLAHFIVKARRVGKLVDRGRSGRIRRSGRDRRNADQSQAIRQWARRNGYAVGTRGRLSPSVIEAFEVEHRKG